ncbi:Asp23/Gls24 family envelope stress response protein [Acetobacterium bakii]|uniref:Alkaline-shock protein n=1 Tax=Acetobacterium bakii TaxID=52689 RepID=A0A0L6U500_9FIRM|nr:Asp23/Gls24 family envelope stress response protein [Acetobacterium bakii]KNZ43593.1 hypothetical protein AKG39_00065 [Acetobacterium bakii]
MKKETRNSQYPEISDEMVYSIVSLAATGVDGVERMSLRITDEIIEKFSITPTVKGVKISHEPEGLLVGVYLITAAGVDIVKVSKEVQAKIKESVESMTGLEIAAVNVRIEGSGI